MDGGGAVVGVTRVGVGGGAGVGDEAEVEDVVCEDDAAGGEEAEAHDGVEVARVPGLVCVDEDQVVLAPGERGQRVCRGALDQRDGRARLRPVLGEAGPCKVGVLARQVERRHLRVRNVLQRLGECKRGAAGEAPDLENCFPF